MFRTKKFLLSPLTLLLILALMLSACGPPSGGTIAVICDTIALIGAINSANADAAPDILELDPGCVYLLTAVDTTVTSTFDGSTFAYGDNGLPSISTPITINGNNSTISRVDSAPWFRIFYIAKTGSLTINDLTLSSGIASGYISGGMHSLYPGSGGAIFNRAAYLEVNRSILQLNQASGIGGAIFSWGNLATTYINDSTIDDNAAAQGGGIFIGAGGLLSIDGSSIINNDAAADGGGIKTADAGEFIVNNSLIASNHSGGRGGAIFKDSSIFHLPAIITHTTIQGNTADGGGGGVFIWRTPLTIEGSEFLENKAGEYGGGLLYENDKAETAHITKTTFDGNTAGFDGGGIHFSGELMIIENSAFQNNKAENGGGIHNANAVSVPGQGAYIQRADTTMEITKSIIQENVANTDGGGVFNDGDLTVEGSTLSRNQSGTLGGGIHNLGKITVQDSTFEGNATGFDGGGLNTYGAARVTGSTFVGNTSERGGGLASVGGDVLLFNSTFSDNTASHTGGGIFNMGSAVGDTSSGGGLQASHVTVAYNSAPAGGGIATSGGLMKIKNSIVAHSPSGGDCSGAGAEFSGVGDNLDTDGSCEGFTLTDEPLLNPLAGNGGPTHTHALRVESPAIDAAPDCTTIWGAAVPVDQRGQPRPGGALCDLGAYEDEVGKSQLESPSYIPITPEVTAIKNANCRSNPWINGNEVDFLPMGETATLLGLNEDASWGFFKLMNKRECWVYMGAVEMQPPGTVLDPSMFSVIAHGPKPADAPAPEESAPTSSCSQISDTRTCESNSACSWDTRANACKDK